MHMGDPEEKHGLETELKALRKIFHLPSMEKAI